MSIFKLKQYKVFSVLHTCIVLAGPHFTSATENLASELRETASIRYKPDLEDFVQKKRGGGIISDYLSNEFYVDCIWTGNILDILGSKRAIKFIFTYLMWILENSKSHLRLVL